MTKAQNPLYGRKWKILVLKKMEQRPGLSPIAMTTNMDQDRER